MIYGGIIVLIVMCAIAWRMGGDEQYPPEARWIGCGFAVAYYAFFYGKIPFPKSILAWASYPLMWCALSAAGYGLSTPIHKFWEKVFGNPPGADQGNDKRVEFCTRFTCGVIWLGILGFWLALVSGKWMRYLGVIPLYAVCVAHIGAFVKDDVLSERLKGGALGLAVALILL